MRKWLALSWCLMLVGIVMVMEQARSQTAFLKMLGVSSAGVTAFDAGSWVSATGSGTCSVGQAGSSCSNSNTSLSYTHTPVGTPTCVVLTFQDNVPLGVTNAFYGSQTMTSAGTPITIPSTTIKIGAYYLTNPNAGAMSGSGLVMNSSIGANFITANIITFTGTGSNCFLAGSYATATIAAGSSVSNSVTSETNDLVTDFFSFDTGGTATPGGGQTIRTCRPTAGTCGSTNTNGSTSTAAGAGSVTMSWSDSSQNWADVAISVQHQ